MTAHAELQLLIRIYRKFKRPRVFETFILTESTDQMDAVRGTMRNRIYHEVTHQPGGILPKNACPYCSQDFWAKWILPVKKAVLDYLNGLCLDCLYASKENDLSYFETIKEIQAGKKGAKGVEIA